MIAINFKLTLSKLNDIIYIEKRVGGDVDENCISGKCP